MQTTSFPSQYLSSQALYLLKLIPLPNSPGTQDGTANNYNAGGTGATNQNQFDVRVDYEVRESMHAFGRYSYFDNANSASTIFGAAGGAGFSSITNDFGGSATGRNQSAVTGMDIALNPKFLTDFRLGYLRYHVSTAKIRRHGEPGHHGRHPGTESRYHLHRRRSWFLHEQYERNEWRRTVQLSVRVCR